MIASDPVVYAIAGLLGVTVGLKVWRAVRRYVGPISLEQDSKFGQVSEARAALMRKTGR